ncbi:MAG: acyl carrier protein [Candidatus Omnitrophica bacterium]|nr:acyl carrier protein [Candidatus Omnitrophota bacterium]
MAKGKEHFNQVREKRHQELFLRIQKVIVKELKIEDTSKISFSARFREDLGVDSLSSIELMMGLEDEFSLEIPDQDSEKILTVEDAVNYLENKI